MSRNTALDERRERYTVVSRSGRVLYEPQDRQLLLHEAVAKNVLFGGAMGGGKSHGLRWHMIMACMSIPELQALLLRREFKDLENTHLLAVKTEVPDGLAAYSTARKRLEFANGSILQFGHCNTDEDFKSWLSTEWEIIALDEATTFTPFQLRSLRMRLRTSKPNLLPQYLLVSNPGGESHLWVKARFMDHVVSKAEEPNYDPKDYLYIPSKVSDNEHVNPEYVETLDNLPEDERRAYRDGDWDVFAGQYFKQLRREIHSFSFTELRQNREWFEKFKQWPKYRSFDWGYTAPSSMGWWAIDVEGNPWRYRELYVAGMEIEDFAATALQMGADDGAFEYTVADPNCWSSHLGPSISERSAKAGLPMVPAEKDRRHSRIDGWSLMRRYIDPNSLPILRVAEECGDWWRTVPTLIHDKKKVEDLDTTSEDHAADDTRFFLHSRPAPAFKRKEDHQRDRNPFTPGTPSYYARERILRDRVLAGRKREARFAHPEFGELW